MNKWLVLLLSLLAFGAVGIGCGDDDDDDGGSADTATSETPAATSPETTTDTGGAAAGGTVRVGMKDIKYVPMDVRVKAGGTVRWTNSDSVPHTVTKEAGPGPKFDSGNLAVGANFEQKFDAPGRVEYVCTIHPNQTGTVTVE
jgi:plastocyanin